MDLELTRYVHLNPVRVGLAADPHRYPWSSFRWYMDARKAPSWLDWRTVLAQSASYEAQARMAYRAFVLSGIQGDTANSLAAASHDSILGSDQFAADVRLQLGWGDDPSAASADEVVQRVAMAIDPESIRSRGRQRNVPREIAISKSASVGKANLESIARKRTTVRAERKDKKMGDKKIDVFVIHFFVFTFRRDNKPRPDSVAMQLVSWSVSHSAQIEAMH